MVEKISEDVLASIQFNVSYHHNGIQHTDCYYGQRVNLWRDILPQQLFDEIQGKQTGDRIELDFKPNTIVSARYDSKISHVHQRQVDNHFQQGDLIQPRFGRFYPQGILKDLPGVFPNNMAPFRCISANGSGIKADLNHLLAEKSIQFSALITEVRDKFEERGGTSID